MESEIEGWTTRKVRKRSKFEGGMTMGEMYKIIVDSRFVLTGAIIIALIGGAVNVADAPPLEATTPATILCYQVDDAGRIIDGDGRIRGWLRGSEVYGPGMELKFRFEGRRLESVD